MTKQSTKLEFNTFVQGFITEASPLNFPKNATKDEQNFVLNKSGTRSRRRGFDLEPAYALFSTRYNSVSEVTSNPPTGFKWSSVASNPSLSFVAVQFKNWVQFFDLNTTPLSNSYKGEVQLTSFPETVQFSFTAIEGSLVVAAGVDEIAIIDYVAPNFTARYERIKTRDLWGIEIVPTSPERATELDLTLRPGFPVTQAYNYNLQNQSWGIPRKNRTGALEDPQSTFYAESGGKYPSNSDSIWLGLYFQATSGEPFERLYTNLFIEQNNSGIPAAKGYFIIDALRRGQSRIDAYTANLSKYPELNQFPFTTRADFTPGGASVVNKYAGRVWYGGFQGTVIDGDARSPDLSNMVFFTQLIRNKQDFSKCYQEGDPTSRDSADLVATDGGFIKIDEAEQIIGMKNLGSTMIIFATNGVWQVLGGSDYGFTATEYKVNKLSKFGCISKNSIVEDGTRVYYWGEDGIYFVEYQKEVGQFVVSSLTDTTIQKFYLSIPNTVKSKSTACYDNINKTVRWLYKLGNGPFTSSSETYELIFDTVIGAFSKNRIYNPTNNRWEVFYQFSDVQFSNVEDEDNVVVNDNPVLVNSVTVTSMDVVEGVSLQSTRYLVVHVDNDGKPTLASFGYYRDDLFRDWPQVVTGGVDAYAYMITGDITGGDSSRHKQTPYITTHMEQTETGTDGNGVPQNQSGCLLRSRWDFSDSAASGKWGVQQQIYRHRRPFYAGNSSPTFDNGVSIVTAKSKLRGRGRAFALSMETEPLKDCRIIGWSLDVNANSV